MLHDACDALAMTASAGRAEQPYTGEQDGAKLMTERGAQEGVMPQLVPPVLMPWEAGLSEEAEACRQAPPATSQARAPGFVLPMAPGVAIAAAAAVTAGLIAKEVDLGGIAAGAALRGGLITLMIITAGLLLSVGLGSRAVARVDAVLLGLLRQGPGFVRPLWWNQADDLPPWGGCTRGTGRKTTHQPVRKPGSLFHACSVELPVPRGHGVRR